MFSVSQSMLRGLAAVVIFFFCLGPATPGLLAQALPELPPLTVENFAPAIREQAQKAYKEAVGRRPDYLPAQVRLADLLLAAGQMGESQRLYEAVLQKSPGSVFAHYG